MSKRYLLDTHALLFWVDEDLPEGLNALLNEQQRLGNVLVSSVSFWEIALKAQKEKLDIGNVEKWGNELLSRINLKIVEPTWTEMIQSTLLPIHHKDPFDRLLIVQANHHNAFLVTQDSEINKYKVKIFWK